MPSAATPPGPGLGHTDDHPKVIKPVSTANRIACSVGTSLSDAPDPGHTGMQKVCRLRSRPARKTWGPSYLTPAAACVLTPANAETTSRPATTTAGTHGRHGRGHDVAMSATPDTREQHGPDEDQDLDRDRGKPWENTCSIGACGLCEPGVDHCWHRHRTARSCSAVTSAVASRRPA